MGGPRIDPIKVRNMVLEQTGCFTYQDIARLAKISTASAHKIQTEMFAAGSIILDHKQGKSKLYAVAGTVQTTNPATGAVEEAPENAFISSLPPAERFKYVGALVGMVAQGISPSIMVTGLSGIGKTHLVKKHLKENLLIEDDDYIMVSGKCTPLGLYRILYEHQHQRIVFDDCDSIFKDHDSLNILKAALDSYDVRKVDWRSSKLPDDLEPSFEFEGQIIFVSNLTADRIDEAVKSRTIVIDLQMSRKEICAHLWNILDEVEPDMERSVKEIVLTAVEKTINTFEQFNIRTFMKACKIYQGAQLGGHDWEEMLKVVI